MLSSLLGKLSGQIEALKAWDQVEVLVEMDDGEKPTGTKRNKLLELAKGEYTVFIDDDNGITDCYVREILKAAESKPDAIGINGWMTTNNTMPVNWFISKNYGYCASKDSHGNTIYERWNNHISPTKREITIKFRFQDIYYGEDFEWSKRMHESGLIQTEVVVVPPIYHYDFKTVKK